MRFNHRCVCVLVTVAIAVGAIPARAQSNPTEFGVKVGVNFATVKNFAEAVDYLAFDTSLRTGILFGGYIGVPLSEHMFVQPEFLFVQRGIKMSGGVRDVPADAAVKLTYLEIPVLFQYRFGSEAATPYVFAGPAVGINISAHVSASLFGGDDDQDIAGEVRTSDLSIVLGGGVLSKWWLAEFRYSEGISVANERSSDFGFYARASEGARGDLRNRGLAAVFGVRF